MASALAGDDLARSTSSRRSTAAMGSRRSMASGSLGELWQAPPDVFTRSGRQSGSEDEEELRWAAIERLPTYDRLRKGVLSKVLDNGLVVLDEVDVTRLGAQDKKHLMESILKVVEDDNDKFLRRLRDRTDRFCSLSLSSSSRSRTL
ncbi:Pleiotropic drug resistance protein [Actinidia chinensis var. chinensis]|uniref:Pleiotropic drug resistance protein n=1 Tax=Actinidia chinensis var. chinensis TaxID=1590841 RepID=A0A2R6QW21_ACTCC|nr:Pleiotropic drug resistance protein [Actinidia chinensis var. chinensis]